jgi:hypothetical protein
MSGYFRSLKLYGGAVLKAWWALFIGILLGAAGGYSLIWHVDLKLPPWGWFLAAVLCLSVAQFQAFHEMRMQRDTAIARAEEAEREGGLTVVKMTGPGVHSNVFGAIRVNVTPPPPPQASGGKPDDEGKK